MLYVDSHFVVYAKPAGMPAHPLPDSQLSPTALDVVGAEYPDVLTASLNPREGGLCHRLDNDTSGVLVFARDPETHQKTRQAFSTGEAKRIYVGIAQGLIHKPLTLSHPIAHHAKNKRKMVVVQERTFYRGQPQQACTLVVPVALGQNATLFVAKLEGGRRHQIRVHLAQAGHPLVGDVLYQGPEATYLPGQALHAASVKLPQLPVIQAPLPDTFQQEIAKWGIQIDLVKLFECHVQCV